MWRLQLAQALCRRLPPIVSQRLRSWIYPSAAAFSDDYEFVARAQTGSLLRGTTSDLTAYTFSVHGYWDWRIVAAALAICSAGDTIIEIGGNTGTETIAFADIVGPSGHVYTFEPLPANLARLQATLALNGASHVTVFPWAVAEWCGCVHLRPPSRHNSGDGCLVAGDDQTDADTVAVHCVTLDSLADELGPARVIFMDVEGAEQRVLCGARSYIERHKPCIVLDDHRHLLRRAGLNVEDLYAQVQDMGYEVYEVSRLGLSSLDLAKPGKAAWLCVHRSRGAVADRVQNLIRRCGILPCVPGLNPMTRN